MADAEKIRVVVCMGSSCFSRGNRQTLMLLQDYIRKNGIDDRVDLIGSLCEDSCTCGPNITINGTRCSTATPESCIQLVQEHLQRERLHKEPHPA